MLGGGDPPRRPPQRNPLVRSKSCYGPTRRKRGREVLEDITWIVNHPSSWQQNDTAGPAHPSALAREDGSLGQTTEELEEAVDGGLPSRNHSNALLLDVPTRAAAPSIRSITINMARTRSDSALPPLDTDTSNAARTRSQIRSSNTLYAPRASTSRITNLDSSSPPSSPARYGLFSANDSANGSGSGSGPSNAGLGLSRAATTLPFLTVGQSNPLSSSSSSLSMRRTSTGGTSPSLRAPPPLRRTSSNSSISSMDGGGMSSSSTSTSPLMLGAPFSGTSSRALTRAATMPVPVPSTPSSSFSRIQATRILPVPTIQREMPSPERKRSRRTGREIEEDEEDEDEVATDEEV